MPKNRLLGQESNRSSRRRRKLFKRKEKVSPSRTKSMPQIRIVATQTNELDCIKEVSVDFMDLPSRRQMQSQEEDELLRLRMQLQAESAAKKKSYSASSLPRAATFDFSESRVSAKRSLVGPPTIPNAATHFGNERVLRRFPTPPPRPKSSIQPVTLHMEDDDDEAFSKLDPNNAASSSRGLFCGIPTACNPSRPKSVSPIPGIEMQESFRTLLEPINDKARQLFGSSARAPDDDGANSAVTEPFDNRSLQRNSTWATTFSVQDYLHGWNLAAKEKRDDTPTIITQHHHVQTISPVASQDLEWDTTQIADRMEQNLNVSAISEQSEDAVNSEACVFPVEIAVPPSSPGPVTLCRADHKPSEYRLASPDNRGSFARLNARPAGQVKTKDFRPASPKPSESFWEELISEGVVEQEDFSHCSGGFGVEVVNLDD